MSKEKKKFVIPVTWEVYSTITVSANNLEEALSYCEEHLDEIPLGTEPEYVDGSYRLEPEIADEEGAVGCPKKLSDVKVDVPDDYEIEEERE